MDINDTDKKLLDGVVTALQERGTDWSYPEYDPNGEFDPRWHLPNDGSCLYTSPDGTAACLVGVALDRGGFERPGYGESDNHEGALDVLRNHAPGISQQVANFLTDAQSNQDLGINWGRTVKFSLSELHPDQEAYLLDALKSAGIDLEH